MRAKGRALAPGRCDLQDCLAHDCCRHGLHPAWPAPLGAGFGARVASGTSTFGVAFRDDAQRFFGQLDFDAGLMFPPYPFAVTSSYDDRISRMHSNWIDIFHMTNDDRLPFSIPNDFEFYLLPTGDTFFN